MSVEDSYPRFPEDVNFCFTETIAMKPTVAECTTFFHPQIKIEWDGAIHEVTCDAETTVLDAAMEAGIELPHSCMSGSCLTCPAKLKSGKVDQSEGVLEEEQTDAVSSCSSHCVRSRSFERVTTFSQHVLKTGWHWRLKTTLKASDRPAAKKGGKWVRVLCHEGGGGWLSTP